MSASLITGAAGFIGRRLALALCADAHDVRGLVRPGHDTHDLEAAGVEIVRGDASDRDTMIAAAGGCRVIYHLAAARGPRKLGNLAYQEKNRRLSEAVGRAAAALGVERVVVSSAATVTGYSGPDAQTEATTPRPNSAYRSSRLADERAFARFAETLGVDVVIARLPQRVLGPGARDWARPARAVRDGRICFLPAGGSVHSGDVDDIVDGLRRCAAPGLGGRCFLLGAPGPVSTHSLLEAFARHLGVPFQVRIVPASPFRAYVALGNVVYRTARLQLPYHFTAEFHSARVVLDLGRARRELGYAPRYEIFDSVRRTVGWLREQGLV